MTSWGCTVKVLHAPSINNCLLRWRTKIKIQTPHQGSWKSCLHSTIYTPETKMILNIFKKEFARWRLEDVQMLAHGPHTMLSSFPAKPGLIPLTSPRFQTLKTAGQVDLGTLHLPFSYCLLKPLEFVCILFVCIWMTASTDLGTLTSLQNVSPSISLSRPSFSLPPGPLLSEFHPLLRGNILAA